MQPDEKNAGNDILDIADHQYQEIQCLFKSQLMNQVAQQVGAYLSYLGWDTNAGGTVRVKSVFPKNITTQHNTHRPGLNPGLTRYTL